MSRVSESSSFHAIKHSVGKTKAKLEDLQIQGSNLKRVQKPSDDPVGNIDILSIRSKKVDGTQYKRNASFAKVQLTFTEAAIEDLTNIMVKAKELAIGQAGNLFDVNIRRGVAKEIEQLKNQAMSIANRRIGNKYLFSGYKSLTKPFDDTGKYQGDDGQTKVEVAKDLFVPISFNGEEVFFEKDGNKIREMDPLAGTNLGNPKQVPNDNQTEQAPEQLDNQDIQFNRTPATEQNQIPGEASTNPLYQEPQINEAKSSIFSELQNLHNALVTDNHEIIQDLLPQMDKTIDRLIESRAEIGSITNAVENAVEKVEKQELINEEYKSKIEDADLAELYTDLTRQQNVLNATYKSSAQLMNSNLMDYIR